MADRKAGPNPRQARLSDESAEGWALVCQEAGVTFSGLLEALGRRLHDDQNRADFLIRHPLFELARKVDEERRSRRRPEA